MFGDMSKFVDLQPGQTVESDFVVSHCAVYAPTSDQVNLGKWTVAPKGTLLMQMRFDGKLGFPGGAVKSGEDPAQGLLREMEEEINFPTNDFQPPELLFSSWDEPRSTVLHFYTLQVPLNGLKSIEKTALEAKEYGHESLGMIRVPLYTMEDGFSGFPAFLLNSFAGNSRDQLLKTVSRKELLTEDQLTSAVKIARREIDD